MNHTPISLGATAPMLKVCFPYLYIVPHSVGFSYASNVVLINVWYKELALIINIIAHFINSLRNFRSNYVLVDCIITPVNNDKMTSVEEGIFLAGE